MVPGGRKYSVLRSMKAIEGQMCLMMIDAVEGITAQEAHIEGLFWKQKRACCGVNKWVAIEKDSLPG